MSHSEQLEVAYDYENIMYTIRGTRDFHERLQTDLQFQQNYFNENRHCTEVIGISTSSTEPRTEFSSEKSETEFVWTRANILLLLNCVLVRKDMFRSSKQKNRNVWSDIQKEFKSKMYIVTVEQLDRKLRNLKKTYKTIKDKVNKTGGGRINWEFYKEMEEIYGNDQSVNPGEAIASFQSSKKEQNVVEISDIRDLPGPSCTIVNENENIAETSQTDLSNLKVTGKENVKHSRAQKGKDLREYRRHLLQMEQNRIAEIRTLRLSIQESNRIQRERNNILRQIAKTKK